jgi:hypothetical protein
MLNNVSQLSINQNKLVYLFLVNAFSLVILLYLSSLVNWILSKITSPKYLKDIIKFFIIQNQNQV